MRRVNAEAMNRLLMQLRDDLIKTTDSRLRKLMLPQETSTSVLFAAALQAAINRGAEEKLLDQINAIHEALTIQVRLTAKGPPPTATSAQTLAVPAEGEST